MLLTIKPYLQNFSKHTNSNFRSTNLNIHFKSFFIKPFGRHLQFNGLLSNTINRHASTTKEDNTLNPTSKQKEALQDFLSFSQSRANPHKRHYFVIGDAGSGKSSFINAITQKNECLVSAQTQPLTHECQAVETPLLDEKSGVFIDTPGFSDARPEMTDQDILNIIMSKVLDLNEKADLGFVLCHSLRSTRSHAESILENFVNLMGQDILKSTMVVLTSVNLMNLDPLSREIRENFIKFVIDRFSVQRDLIVDFDAVEPLPNQREDTIKILMNLPSYNWKNIKSLEEENKALFAQIQEKEKIKIEVMVPTQIHKQEPAILTKHYEKEFLHEETQSSRSGSRFIILEIASQTILNDEKVFKCKLPLNDKAYDTKINNTQIAFVEGDYRNAVAEAATKSESVELKSNLEFESTRKHPAYVKWKLMIDYEFTELRRKTVMVDKKEIKMVNRPDSEIWERVKTQQKERFRERIRKIK